MITIMHSRLLPFLPFIVTAVVVTAFTTAPGRTVCTIPRRPINSPPHRRRRPHLGVKAAAADVVIDGTNVTANEAGTATNKDKAAIIFLHGLGDTPDGWSKLLPEALPTYRPNLANVDITYVFPPAQNVGITVNGGEQMPAWFDIFDWPLGVDAKDDPKGLAMSVKRIEKIVAELTDEEGIDPSRVVLGGFSQGGAVALMAAYNRRKKDAVPFAACACMSGYLPLKTYLDVSEGAAKDTPLFWAHGEHDDKILFEQFVYGVEKLESAGVSVTACSYPVGHESSNFEEIDDFAAFLEDVLCADEATADEMSKSAKAEAGGQTAPLLDDDEKNAVLYYLLAGDADNEAVESSTQESMPMETR
mmetsp:Transcript_20337/g.47764  ORF Transcript_20337/g.47764 Transcript_20337/m.47764 type:complete len:360 (-) Transcript_20337:2258-3337(-)